MGARPPDPNALPLHLLARLARSFDDLSDSEAAGARHPAVEFVAFVRAEVDGARSKFEPGHRPRAKREELRRAAGE